MKADAGKSQGLAGEALLGAKLGNYVLERVLGRGRMGVVFLAADAALLRPTAVKVLAWDFAHHYGENPVEWFLDEARHVAQINHPRVVQIYGAAKQGNTCYIAMEFVDGTSAETLIEENGPLPLERATTLLLDVALALQAAHDAGVIHRDVKPANILVSKDVGSAKLGDFGMSLSRRQMRGPRRHVRAGTPFYAAPELWNGAVASPSSDIYALGATFYFLLTGTPPFPGTSVQEVQEMHLSSRIPDPRRIQPMLSGDVARLLQRAMAKAPQQRISSAAELVEELRALLVGPSTSVKPIEPGGARKTRRPLRDHEPPMALFADTLQFDRQPFSSVSASPRPYDSSVAAKLSSDMKQAFRNPTSVVALAGPSGTGRTTMLEHWAKQFEDGRTVIVVQLSRFSRKGALERELSAALREGHGSLGVLKNRLRTLREMKSRKAAPPLVIIDELSPASIEEFGLLVGSPPARGFGILACGEEEVLARVRNHIDLLLRLPRLTPTESKRYIASWLQATRAPDAPPLLVSPDAHRILVGRSRGVMTLLNRLLLNSLALTAIRGRRVLTSFEAWHAPEHDEWLTRNGPSKEEVPERPLRWPTNEVRDYLELVRATRDGRTETSSSQIDAPQAPQGRRANYGQPPE